MKTGGAPPNGRYVKNGPLSRKILKSSAPKNVKVADQRVRRSLLHVP